MKKLLISSLVLISLTCFAQDSFEKFKLTNKSYPTQEISFECLDAECQSLEVFYINSSIVESSRIIYKTEIENNANVKRKMNLEEHFVPYHKTRDHFGRVGSQWKDGDELRAVGNVALSPFVAVFDTAFVLPLQILLAPFVTDVQVVNGHVGGKRALRISNNKEDTMLKHRRFHKVRGALGL